MLLILVQVFHALVLRKVGKLARDRLCFTHSQLVINVFPVPNEQPKEDAQDDIDDERHSLRVQCPHQEERAHVEEEKLQHEEHEALLRLLLHVLHGLMH